MGIGEWVEEAEGAVKNVEGAVDSIENTADSIESTADSVENAAESVMDSIGNLFQSGFRTHRAELPTEHQLDGNPHARLSCSHTAHCLAVPRCSAA